LIAGASNAARLTFPSCVNADEPIAAGWLA